MFQKFYSPITHLLVLVFLRSFWRKNLLKVGEILIMNITYKLYLGLVWRQKYYWMIFKDRIINLFGIDGVEDFRTAVGLISSRRDYRH